MKKFVVLLFVVLGMFISYDADARKIEASCAVIDIYDEGGNPEDGYYVRFRVYPTCECGYTWMVVNDPNSEVPMEHDTVPVDAKFPVAIGVKVYSSAYIKIYFS